MNDSREHPVILTIAGSDCSGGAGIQADIKAISALGGYAASAITAITVQNTCGVQQVYPLPVDAVIQQIDAVMEDLQPEAVKIGMITNAAQAHALAECLKKWKPLYVVYDPVMVSTSGRRLMDEEAVHIIKTELFPLTTLITPNLCETQVLLLQSITNLEAMQSAARTLSTQTGTSVLIKGGHLTGKEMCDVLFDSCRMYIFKSPKIASKNLHGTGCTLSSSIATLLAMGYPLDAAVREAKAYINCAIREGSTLEIGHENGPLWHFPKFTAQKY